MLGLGLATSKGGFVDALAEVTNTKSIIFDGTNEYVQFGDIEFTGAFSISAWIKFNNLNQETLIGNSANSNWLRFEDTDDIKFKIGNNSITVTNAGAFSTGNWFHFSAVRNSSNVITFYKNGVALSTTGSRSGTFTPERIGQKTSGDTFFDGNIDEVALWDTELSASQVLQIYNNNKATLDLSTNTGSYSSSANLKMWLRMGDGDTFPIIQDQTSNNNDGTMTNMASSAIETDTPVQIYTVANTKSVLFDGSNDFIQAGIINSGNSFTGTFSAWVKRSTTDTGDFIYDARGDSNGGSGYFRFLADDGGSDDDKLDSQGTNTIYVDGVATDTCSAGVWHHVVVAGQTIHVNEDIKIGSSKSGASNFDGNIDEVAIWNTTLTASQVAQIYHGSKANFDLSQNGGGYTSASNLQAWWRMERLHGNEWNPHTSGSGLVINDSAGTESLGTELATSLTWIQDSGNEFETFTTSGNQIIQASNTTGQGICQTSTFSLEENAFYKLSFNLGYTADDADNDTISIVCVGVGNALGLSPRPFQLQNHSTSGSQTYYFKAPSSLSTYSFGFQTGNNRVLTITLSDLSIQKVTGKNFGTMENMASSAIETDTP